MASVEGPLPCEVISPQGEANGSIIWLHGLGADGFDFMPFAKALRVCREQSLRFVSPHAPRRRITFNDGQWMRAWFDVHSLERDGLRDEAGILASAALIEGVIEQEMDRGIPSERIVLGGFSQGGMMALHVGLRYAETLAGVMCLSGALLLHESLASMRDASNDHTPIFLAHGTMDPVLPLAFGQKAQEHLSALAYPLSWHTYPMAHEVCPQEVEDCDRWLQTVLA